MGNDAEADNEERPTEKRDSTPISVAEVNRRIAMRVQPPFKLSTGLSSGGRHRYFVTDENEDRICASEEEVYARRIVEALNFHHAHGPRS
jgi:hypothetical protein